MHLAPTQRGQFRAQPSEPRGQGGFIDEAAGGARDERRLGSAHGLAAARVFHGLGVELTLEDTPGDDDLRDFVGQGVHHRVLPAVVHENLGSRQELGEVEAGRAAHRVAT